MNYLLDTCVISELVAKLPNERVIEWVDSVDEAFLYLSVITVGEIRKGIEKLPESKRKADLQNWLSEELLPRFGNRIVPIDVGVMLAWGQLTGALELAGKTMPAMDSLVAATVRHGGFSLVTRNVANFEYAGIPALDPWK